MMRALFAGVSGLKNHQTRMDVIGNNIANVNTVGFKASRVQFQDVLSQTITGAASAQGDRGGTNPMQVGLGMGLASIDTIFTDGSFQPTGKGTDLSIQGSGFFILSDGNSQVFTRAGNFDFDTAGNYGVPGTGYRVMGWQADATGNINTAGNVVPIKIPVGAAMPAQPSTLVTYANNLSADADVGARVQTSRDVYDSLGVTHKVSQYFTRETSNTWLTNASVTGATGVTGTVRRITFKGDGTIDSFETLTPSATKSTLSFAGTDVSLNNTPDATTTQRITLFGADNTPYLMDLTITTNGTGDGWSYSLTDVSNPTGGAISSGTLTWAGAPDNEYRFDGGGSAIKTFTYPATDGTTFTLDFSDGAPATGAWTFTPDATYTAAAGNGPLAFTPSPQPGADAMTLNFDLNALTQFGGGSTIQATGANGYAAGTLDTTSIDPSGIIVGRFTNGQTQNLGQVALATFNNPAGLNKVGDNLFAVSNNSGVAQIGTSGTGGRGKFNPGTLEMANVDLANEFSNMIITQRGFQANSKIITTTDEMLEQLANLRR